MNKETNSNFTETHMLGHRRRTNLLVPLGGAKVTAAIEEKEKGPSLPDDFDRRFGFGLEEVLHLSE